MPTADYEPFDLLLSVYTRRVRLYAVRIDIHSLDDRCLSSEGDILMFERAENSARLSYLRRLILPSSPLASSNPRRPQRSSDELISSFALSPNEETLLVGTNHNHLYEIAFSKMVTDLFRVSRSRPRSSFQDYTKKETSLFTVAIDGAHQGAILNGVVSLRKAMLFTIGTDRSLKVWNLQTKLDIKDRLSSEEERSSFI